MTATQLRAMNPSTSDLSRLIQIMSAQNELLADIRDSLNRPKLGLHDDPPGVTMIYCNRSKGCLWYTLSEGNPVPITQNFLTGYIQSLGFIQAERRKKETTKLHLTMRCGEGRVYCLESGYQSHFTKCILSSIAALPPAVLSSPFTLKPYGGDEEAVLFCRTWIDGQKIDAGYDADTDWRQVATIALTNVKTFIESKVDW